MPHPGRVTLCSFAGILACAPATKSAPAETAVGVRAVTTYFVSSQGEDSTGTPNDPARPYRSPRGAYADIPADITTGVGDHVIQFVDGSVYGQLTMSPRSTDQTHRIILRATAGAMPTMDAHSTADGSRGRTENNPVLLIQSSHVVVHGLHFVNTNVDTSLGPGGGSEVMVRLEGSSSLIEANYFDGNGRTPTQTDMFLLICNTATNNVVAENRFDFSGGKSLIHVSASCGGGSPGRQVIRNNAFSRFGNNPQGVCAAINFGGRRDTFAGNNSVVENNTIYDNGGGCYGLLNTNTSVVSVRYNIFARITGHRYAVGCGGVNGSSSGVAYFSVMFENTNDVEQSCNGGGWTLATSFAEDPRFVDPGATPPDLHVKSTTGSRRNGTSTWTIDAHCSVAIDRAPASEGFHREPLPNGGRRNLGAYGNTDEASKSCRR